MFTLHSISKKLGSTLLAVGACCLLFTSVNTHAQRKAGDSEFSFYIPYSQGSTINFDGGASAELSKDHGFGFGFTYFFDSKMAMRFDSTWNSAHYTGTRILEDGSEKTFSNVYDAFNLSFGGDYYFMEGPISPFVTANIGWNYLNSNIPSAPATGVCWWDPWWGYVCDTVRPTYSDSSWSYGAGLGVRANVSKNAFLKLGYHQTWIDMRNTRSTPKTNTITLEFGFKLDTGAGMLF